MRGGYPQGQPGGGRKENLCLSVRSLSTGAMEKKPSNASQVSKKREEHSKAKEERDERFEERKHEGMKVAGGDQRGESTGGGETHTKQEVPNKKWKA